jgi:hypothetical protein
MSSVAESVTLMVAVLDGATHSPPMKNRSACCIAVGVRLVWLTFWTPISFLPCGYGYSGYLSEATPRHLANQPPSAADIVAVPAAEVVKRRVIGVFEAVADLPNTSSRLSPADQRM